MQQSCVKAERLPVEQGPLFEETRVADMAAITKELEQLSEPKPKGPATRKPLPPELPRTEIPREPDSTTCGCSCQMKRIGEEVAEKRDYTPGTFTVERPIRGQWACAQCETRIHAPVPAHRIDKGIPTTGLLAHVLIAQYRDPLPLYRQKGFLGRAGLPIPQSTLTEWVGKMGVTLQPRVDALKVEMRSYPVRHADETPVAMLDPGAGKTHRAYLWSYRIGAFEPILAVVYDFAESRAGKHAREFLGDGRGTLVCDDYAGDKARVAEGVTEAGCMARARRTFFDLHAHSQSQIARRARITIQRLYQVEREVAEQAPNERRQIRQEQAKPILEEFHEWLTRHRTQGPDGSSTVKAIDYRLKRGIALAHYIRDGQVSIDNHWIENRIRPIATGRKDGLFAGSLRAGKRAAAIMSLIQSAKLNAHDPFLYLKDMLAHSAKQSEPRIPSAPLAA